MLMSEKTCDQEKRKGVPATGGGCFTVFCYSGKNYNNEVKLAHSNKRTVFQANELTREGDRLIVGSEIAPYKAIVLILNWLTLLLMDAISQPEEDYVRPHGVKILPFTGFMILVPKR